MTVGVSVGVKVGLIAIGDVLLKLISSYGSIISGVTAAIVRQGEDAAIVFFIDQSPVITKLHS